MKAYISAETKPGTAIRVVKQLKEKNAHIVSADAIFGRFDAIFVVEAPSLDDIDRLVYTVIQSDPDVTRTETSIVLELKQP